MKDLYILRHAKSSWSNLQLSDLQRPLNGRGRHDSPLIGQVLAEIAPSIDELIISPSERTKETSINIKKYVNFLSERVIDRLYHASTNDISDVVSMIEDSSNSVLLVGHNPGLTFFHNEYATKEIDNLPTCGLYRIRIDANNWSDMDTTNSKVDYYRYPKMFY
ncbi:MAG: phosphohistidine phosphatase [Saprospiraceae bacterium]